MSTYMERKKISDMPRLPLSGLLDLTYRCNNNCHHCWLKVASTSEERQKELSLDEIKKIIDDARKMGCRKWFISGGEPMIRPDFAEIIEYITSKSMPCILNTNGTLITPKIAQVLKKADNYVALYGATAKVHDHVTRNPGSFDATMQGFAYLKEAGAAVTVQMIPMKDNYHEYDDMVRLADSLGLQRRIGASWFFLSAYRDPEKNREIIFQRLDPKHLAEIDKPTPSTKERLQEEYEHIYARTEGDKYFFASCTSRRDSFHIDPYGQMSFCYYIKEPEFRYDLRKGSFQEGWDKFIPSLGKKMKVNKEYLDNCGSCEYRRDCYWCPVFGYLEHGRYSAKVEYLCDVVKERRRYLEEWKKDHRRYYQIAGITIQLDSDLLITDSTFSPKFKLFQVDHPGEDIITFQHHFSLPNLSGRELGKQVYQRAPWTIYKKDDSWIYVSSSVAPGSDRIHKIAVFSHDYTRAKLYTADDTTYKNGNQASLSLFPTDQIILAQVLADREGCFMHSSGLALNGKGLLFVGHSDAGKSTMVTMLKDHGEILCDDRVILRRWPEGYRIHGTWSHGDIKDVSPVSVPLKAVLFLEQARDNQLIVMDDKREIMRRLLACLVKPVITDEWWGKMLTLVENMVRELPFYTVRFDRSGGIVDLLKNL